MINELRLLAEDLHSLSGTNKYATAMSEAADEIEHLRQERDEWAAKWHTMRRELANLKYPAISGTLLKDNGGTVSPNAGDQAPQPRE